MQPPPARWSDPVDPVELEARVRLSRWSSASVAESEDVVAHEEPLELQVHGTSVAVIMRTPGHDEELALGFLLSEGVISTTDDVEAVHHCSQSVGEAEENVVRVLLREGLAVDLERLRRNLYASSSCGLCGKASIEAAMRLAPPLSAATFPPVEAARLYEWPRHLREQQPAFDATGGLHGAGLFDPQGRLAPLVREDVGRHNAVDKVLGAMLRLRRPTASSALLVSGRVGFELVQKAAAGRIPILAGVSAPTSLAVRAAQALGITVVGFLRDQRMNVYTHPSRIGAGDQTRR